jgi:aldose 1-epimerase
MDGAIYMVTPNDNGNCLHGGSGFSFKMWKIEDVTEDSVTLSYYSPDGEDGFPNGLLSKVKFTLSGASVIIDYEATPEGKTPIALTNHSYFNLDGFGGLIDNHVATIYADRYTDVNENLIPNGNKPLVEDTAFDFRSPKKIGKDIACTEHIQIKNGNGYDHNFIINSFDGSLKTCAVAKGDKSGITMEVKTTLPGVQFYTGNFLDGTVIGKAEKPLTQRCSFCLETQVFPDSPNHQDWCKCVYDKDEVYSSKTVFAFSL